MAATEGPRYGKGGSALLTHELNLHHARDEMVALPIAATEGPRYGEGGYCSAPSIHQSQSVACQR
jgi:hypothetical protein